MNLKETRLIYYLSVITLSILFVIISMSIFSQAYVPITNYHNGISIGIQGTEGADYVFDRYYFDPLINDCGLCYIKSDVDIELSHNDYNSRIHKQSTVIRGGDFGNIRYKIDKDWQNSQRYADDGNCYPMYPGPFSFDDMEYEAGVPVVGTVGFKPGYLLTDRVNAYSRGMLDEAGNEYHYFTYYDDDSDGWAIDDDGEDVVGTSVDTEESASDGKSMLFCVNPRTPAIWLSAAVSGAEYYTTPAKVWYVPKIHEQTSYVTDNVDIQLKNIMNSNGVYYQIDGGGYQQYIGAISSNSLSDGEHTLEFYYDANYVQTRKIVKNPDHPSKQDVFEDGSAHGYLLWKDEAEFLRFKERMLNGVWSNGDYYALHYKEYKSRNLTDFSYNGNNGVRNQYASQELMFAMVGVLEGVSGNQNYMKASKVRLMNNPHMHIETIGWETQHSYQASPSHELTYRGYTDDKLLYKNAFTYDLLVKYYRSDQYAGGITPIEDYRLRDMMASTVHETMMFHGSYETWLDPDVNLSSYEYMWITARAEAGVITSLTMPGYNTSYYGTAGYDGTQATHLWAPYPDYPESWKDVFLTYTDNSNSAHVAKLNPFPNRTRFFNWFDGSNTQGLIRDNGDWADKSGYGTITNMGHGFEIFYNVMRRKFNITYPKFHQYMQKSLDGTVWCNKEPQYAGYPRGMMANEFFPDLAPQAIDAYFTDDKKYLYQCAPYYFFFHNPEWESAPTCQSTAPPTVPENLEGNVSETSITLSWDASTHSECSVAGYKITKDGAEIAVVQETSYTDAGLSQGVQYEYAVASVSEAGIISENCSPVQFTTIADDDPPTIALVPNTDITTSVFIEFSENLDLTSAETVANYSINNGVAVTSAQLLSDNKTVSITVSTLNVGTQYTITVNNVSDTDGNVIAANSTAVFSCVAPSANLALNKPVTADSELNTDYSAANAVDGITDDNASRWISYSSAYPHWIEIDLLQTSIVDKVEFYTGHTNADYLVYDYQIQYWDGTAWIDAVSVTGNTLANVSHSFAAVSTEKLRLYCTDGQDNIVRLFEIEAYNNSGSTVIVDVDGISVSPVSLNLDIGETSDLTETVTPANATDKTVTWSSSNEAVATVDSSGLITAVSEGSCTITATTIDGGFSASCIVTVSTANTSPINIALNKPVTVDSQYSTDYPPEYGVDGNHTDNASRWISASSAYPHWIEIDLQDIYSVSETKFWTGRYSTPYPVFDYQIQYWDGNSWIDAASITGNTSGEVTDAFSPVTTDKMRLYCTAGQDNTVRLFEIEVWGVPESVLIPVSGVSIDLSSLSLTEGETMSLTAAITPSDATDQAIIWSSSDASVASVDSTGAVSALSAGQATITVTTNDGGYAASCEVTVNVPIISVTGVSVTPVDLSLVEGQTSDLTESVLPTDATDKSILWSSSNSSIATVDANGLVSAIAEGEAIITVTTHDGGFTATTNVTVGPASSSPANIALNKPVTADSQYSTDYPPEYGVDGNHTDNASRWISASSAYPHWIEIDLQGTYDVSKTRFWTGRYSDPYPVNDYQIQYWDGSNWIDAVSINGNVSGDVTNTFPPVTTDKMRLYCTAGQDNTVRLFEIEVWGVPASATTTPVTGISIDQTSLSLTVGETMALTAAITPSDATDQTVIWSTSDASVASIDSTGVVSALSGGQAIVTVTTNDGGYTANCSVTVSAVSNGEFLETFGTGTAATIAEYSGWDNSSPIVYTGGTTSPGYSKIADSPVSELYDGASGGSNVQIKAGYTGSGWFQVEGINTYGFSDIVLSFGYVFENWSSLPSFTVMVSTDDGANWTQLTNGTSTATGGDWNLMTYENIPAAQNLMIKFDMAERKYIYIDDIVISTSSAKGLHLDAKSLFNEKSVKLYPNPVSDNYFMLDLEGFDDEKGEINLRIFDVTGKMVYSDIIKTKFTEIPCNLFKGIYFISIDNNTFSTQEKLIVR